MKTVIFTDGGSRGNPGPAGIGIVITADNKVLLEHAEYLGVATNNEAEYQAVVKALEWLVKHHQNQKISEMVFFLDSKLVVEQLQKNWKIKEPRLKLFAQKCWQLLGEINLPYSFSHVVRSKNAQADALVNQALDTHAE